VLIVVLRVCRSPSDPLDWLITSEWETLDHFLEWEKTPEHRELVKPMRERFAETKSLKYVVRQETSHG
jgi:heme oxygenase (mycobilin-producing)